MRGVNNNIGHLVSERKYGNLCAMTLTVNLPRKTTKRKFIYCNYGLENLFSFPCSCLSYTACIPNRPNKNITMKRSIRSNTFTILNYTFRASYLCATVVHKFNSNQIIRPPSVYVIHISYGIVMSSRKGMEFLIEFLFVF